MMLYPNISTGKTAGEHTGIWLRGGLTVLGVGSLVKGGKILAKVYKLGVKDTWLEVAGDVEKGRRKVTDVHDKLQDPTGVGWIVWGMSTAGEIGGTILECATPYRFVSAGLGVTYSYYRNWQGEWVKEINELKEIRRQPYTEKELPPELFYEPTDPGSDHPDDYKGILATPFAASSTDDFQRVLQEYDELSLKYLAFEIGLSIDDPVCDYEMEKFLQKIKTTNPDYDKHLEEVQRKSEEAYQAAYEVQKQVCLLYYGTISETSEFPHFKTREEVESFLNSLTL